LQNNLNYIAGKEGTSRRWRGDYNLTVIRVASYIHNLIRGKHEENKTMDHCITNAKTNAETYDQSNSGKIHN